VPFVAPVTSHRHEARKSSRLSIVAAAVAALSWFGSSSYAQDASGGSPSSDPFAGVEEMIVVGTGAAALLQSQEVSAIKFDASYLEALGASDLSDISQFTPNLEIRTPFAASNPTLFIRGVGIRDFNANSSSSVAVYNDEIYMNSPAGQLSQLFDVENVDVLRGPQTTIYGRNSSAGTIRVLAKKPTGTPGGTFKATYGRFNQVQLEGAIENVIVPDLISMRSSFRTNQRDGFVRNRCADPRFNTSPGLPVTQSRAQRVFNQCFNFANTDDTFLRSLDWSVGEVPPVKQWVNDQSNWGARTLIRYQQDVGDVGLDFILNFHGGQNRGDARQFQMVGATQLTTEISPRSDIALDTDGYTDPDNQVVPPGGASFKRINDPFDGNPYEGDYNNVEKEKLDLFGSNLVGKLDYGNYSVTSVTGYEWNKRDVELNLDGNPYVSLEPILSNRAYQVTQELRVDYDGDDGFSWQLAGMYLYEGLTALNRFGLSVTQAVPIQEYSFFTRYGAGWLNAAWEPAENFKVEGGARINYEDKEIQLFTSREDLAGQIETFPPAYSATRKIGAAGDIKGTWTPIEDLNFYLRYARGWKGPHINGGVVNSTQRTSTGENLISPVEPEEIDSVELGMKGVLWGSRLTANWAMFYYDYNDIQIFRLLNVGGGVPVQQLVNADDADVLGFEAEFDIKPFEDWGPMLLDKLWIHATFAWLDSKYTDFVNTQVVQSETPGGSPLQITITEDFSGNRLINSPEYSFIGFVAWPLGGEWGAVIPRLDWTFKDKVYFDTSNSELLKQDPLWLLNFRLTYKAPTENFEISGWVENLTDQAYTVDVFNLARLRRAILHAVGDPRTYGVTATVKF
jgi:iron complex outermembrane recepter protein